MSIKNYSSPQRNHYFLPKSPLRAFTILWAIMGLTDWAGGGRGVLCTSIWYAKFVSGTLYGCSTKNRTESFWKNSGVAPFLWRPYFWPHDSNELVWFEARYLAVHISGLTTAMKIANWRPKIWPALSMAIKMTSLRPEFWISQPASEKKLRKFLDLRRIHISGLRTAMKIANCKQYIWHPQYLASGRQWK